MTDFPARVERIFERIGKSFGDGTLKGKLVRPGEQTGDSYKPTIGTPTKYDFIAVWDRFTQEERNSGLIEDNEHVILIGAETLTETPATGDTIEVDSDEYRVKKVETIEPAGVDLMYRVKVLQ